MTCDESYAFMIKHPTQKMSDAKSGWMQVIRTMTLLIVLHRCFQYQELNAFDTDSETFDVDSECWSCSYVCTVQVEYIGSTENRKLTLDLSFFDVCLTDCQRIQHIAKAWCSFEIVFFLPHIYFILVIFISISLYYSCLNITRDATCENQFAMKIHVKQTILSSLSF